MTAERSAGTAARTRFRPDVEGLRAVAVLLVVAHHVELPGFRNGFIGVDVFFVISGFLITSKLLTESQATGRIDLAAFWSSRIRRLLPIAATAIAVTLIAGLVLLNPLEWQKLVTESRAGSLFVANFHFAGVDTGYFAESTRESPFLHLWSLAVEEQFYVLLPLVLWATLRLRSDERSLELPALTVGALSVGSLVIAAVLTSSGSPHAYYSLASRGWELGAGALLAFSWPRLNRGSEHVRGATVAAGAATLVAGLLWIDAGAFPAWGAVFPVAGTVLLIVGEPSGAWADRSLCSAPMRSLGGWSYGWYLWHWPAIVLGTTVLGESTSAKVALALGSLAVAAVTYRVIEQPVRRSGLSRRGTLQLGGLMLLSLLLVVQLGQLRSSTYFADDTHARIAAARRDFQNIEGECIGVDAASLRAHCSTGADLGAPPILLYGDSHMAHWRSAIEPAAAAIGVPTVRSILGDCFSLADGRTNGNGTCTMRADRVEHLVDELQPALMVVGFASTYRDVRVDGVQPDDQLAAWTAAVERLATHLRDVDVPLLVLLDVPRYTDDPLECMVTNAEWRSCALSTAEVREFHHDVNDAIRLGLERAGHGTVFDPIPLLCPGATCLLDVDGEIVPQDTHHITRGFAESQAAYFENVLQGLVLTDAV